MSAEDLNAWSPQKLQTEIERCQRKLIEKNQHLRNYYDSIGRAQRDWMDMMDADGLPAEELECLKADLAEDKPWAAFPVIDPTVEDRILNDVAALERRLRNMRQQLEAHH
jgi:hypothetical protein